MNFCIPKRPWGLICFLNAATLAVFFHATFVQSALSQNPPSDEILKRVLQGLKHRREQLNPAWIKFEVWFSETKEWKTGRRKGSAGKSRAPQVAEFAVKGNKYRWKVYNQDADLSPWVRETSLLFNGEIEITQSSQENQYLISRSSSGHQLAEPPLEIVGENGLLGLLDQWDAGKMRFQKVIITEKVEEGEKLLVIEIVFPPPGWTNKYWLLADKGFLVRRSEVYDEKGQPVNKAEAKEIADEKGVSYPVRGKREHYMGGGKLGYIVDFQVTSVETKPSRIPDSLFTFQFPEDALIYDQDLQVMVRNTDLTQSQLLEVIHRAGGPRSLWREWWFLLMIFLSLVAFSTGFILWRRKRRST